MANPFFHFKQFSIHQDRAVMRVTTDACLFGAWVAHTLTMQQYPLQEILDIGTGTGLLSLMLAQKTTAHIDALEIDEQACMQASENVKLANRCQQIRVIETALQAFTVEKKYGHIICNPPFFKNDLKSTDKYKNLSKHEENLTLHEICTFIAANLTDAGTASILIPYNRISEALTTFKKTNLYMVASVAVKQTPQHDFFRCIVLLQTKPLEDPNTTTLIIKTENDAYSEDFSFLLKDYYLQL